MIRFSTECSRKLFYMIYGSKKEFENFVMLYINRKVATLFIIGDEGKYVLKKSWYSKVLSK